MKCHWRWKVLIALGGMLVLLVLAINPRTLPVFARWLDVGGPPQKADAIVLLNGSLDSRPFVAAALVHGGWAPKILVNTVADHAIQISGDAPPFVEINLRILDYGGVPRNQVECLDSAARTTFDEAVGVDRYLADHPAKKLMIVTEGPHTRRSRWIFRQVLGNRPVEIVMISAPTDRFDSENWWRSEIGFLFVVSEYFKLFYYSLRYGWLGCEIVGGLLVMLVLYASFARRRKLAPTRIA